MLKARPAELRDAAAIAEIYNQGIDDRIATFETEHRTTSSVEGLLGAQPGRYPAVVVEDEHCVLGFAWCSEYRPREAYAGVAEFSIYVARDARGRGVGRLCLGALITEAERRGFRQLRFVAGLEIGEIEPAVAVRGHVRDKCVVAAERHLGDAVGLQQLTGGVGHGSQRGAHVGVGDSERGVLAEHPDVQGAGRAGGGEGLRGVGVGRIMAFPPSCFAASLPLIVASA